MCQGKKRSVILLPFYWRIFLGGLSDSIPEANSRVIYTILYRIFIILHRILAMLINFHP